MVICSPCSPREELPEHLPPALIRQDLSRQVFLPFYANTPSCAQDIKCDLQLLQLMPNYFLASDIVWLFTTHLYEDSCSNKARDKNRDRIS